MVDDADMGVEGGPGPEGDEVAALLGVDQQDPLTGPEDAPIPVGPHVAQRPDGLDGPGPMVLTTRRSPGFSFVR